MTSRRISAWILSIGLLWTCAAGCARDTWRARPLEQLTQAARRPTSSGARGAQPGAAQQHLVKSQGPRPTAVRNVAQLEQQRCDAQCQAALVRWRMGDVSGCRKILVDLLKRNPVHLDGNLLLAELYLLNQQPEKVVYRFQRLKDHHPGQAQLLHTLALALDAVGEGNQALAYYAQAVQLAPTDPDYEFSYEMAQAESAKDERPRKRVEPHLANSDRSCLAEHGPTSLNAQPVSFAQEPASKRPKFQLNAVPAESPEITSGSSSKDLSADEKGESQPALGGSSVLVESSSSAHKGGQAAHATPSDPTQHKDEQGGPSGKTQLRLHSEDDESSAAQEDATTSDGEDPSAQAATHLDSATALLAAGDVVQAARHLRQALECAPEEIDVALAAGSAALRFEQPQLAADLLRSSSVGFPESARLYRSLGTAYYRSGQYSAARLALRQSLSLDKASALTYFLLGNTLRKLGHTSEADEMLAQAAQRDSRFASLGQVRPVQ